MISVSNLTISFGARALFDNVSFFVGEKDCIGLVGKNGVGKSSLLKTMAGIDPRPGVSKPKEVQVGYLAQEMKHNISATVMEEASSSFKEVHRLHDTLDSITKELEERTDYETDAYNELIIQLNDANDRLAILGSSQNEEQIAKVLTGLGFVDSDFDRQLSEFSGGWQMRVELSKLLLQLPQVLLLDEPTNHLDIESISWLEKFLTNYPGAIIVISHDKAFLDKLTNRTIEINQGKIYDYKMAYSKYLVQREGELERQLLAYKNQQKYIEDTKKLINKFRAKKNKAAFAQTLIRKLEKLDRIELDDIDSKLVRIGFPPAPRSGKEIINAKALGKSYDGKIVFKDLDLIMPRSAKVAMVGKNGAGKTTLTKIITGGIDYDGYLKIGHNVDIGYYAQNQTDELDCKKTVFDTIDDEAVGDMRTKVRSLLGSFLFSGDDITKKVSVLSGGEKARLALCKLLLHPYNLLILDEPTNHLDMASKEILKTALKNYDGSLILVSHDRDFISGLVDTIYEVTPTGLKQFIGDIFDFLALKEADSIAQFEQLGSTSTKSPAPSTNSAQKLNYEERKELDRNKRKLTNLISRCERDIETLEKELKELDEIIANIDYGEREAADKVLQEYAKKKETLEQTMTTWEEANAQLDDFADE